MNSTKNYSRKIFLVRKLLFLAAVFALAGSVLVWQYSRKYKSDALAPLAKVVDSPVVASPDQTSASSLPHAPVKQDITDPLAANIQVGDRRIAVRSNTRGEFFRVLVAPSALIKVDLPFFGAAAGEALAIQTEDGGALVSGVADGRVLISEGSRARFDFRAAAHDGLNRVTLRRGGETRVLEFWVGPEAPVLVRR
jgi:hypothetical protein